MTTEANRIDLVLTGEDWVIVLENKIWHRPVNPFEKYRDSIATDPRFRGKHQEFVILAPYDPRVEGWIWIPYSQLIAAIRSRLDAGLSADNSKWIIFLKELMLNIEELTDRRLHEDDFNFVRSNYREFIASVALLDRYIQELRTRVASRAEAVFGQSGANVVVHNWPADGTALRVFPDRSRKHNATLLVCLDGGFRVQFYVEQDRRKPGVERAEFLESGVFRSFQDESSGALWVFARDEQDPESALSTLEHALRVLRGKVEWSHAGFAGTAERPAQ